MSMGRDRFGVGLCGLLVALLACSGVWVVSENAGKAAPAPAKGKVVKRTKKKGACIALRRAPERVGQLKALRAGWFYTWGAEHGLEEPPKDMQFVPMIWGKWGLKDEIPPVITRLIEGRKAGRYECLLGFNEPDNKEQANMTVAEAIERWPKLMKTGLRLGSPGAVQATGPWMREFMKEIDKRKYRVDFIAVHWYNPPDAGALLGHVKNIHKLYGRPIWITEFAAADWKAASREKNRYTPAKVAEFMKRVVPQLEKLDYVKGYAWYLASPADKKLGPSALFTKAGKLTKLGKLYASY
jgi:hypothetical protein